MCVLKIGSNQKLDHNNLATVAGHLRFSFMEQ